MIASSQVQSMTKSFFPEIKKIFFKKKNKRPLRVKPYLHVRWAIESENAKGSKLPCKWVCLFSDRSEMLASYLYTCQKLVRRN